MPHKPGTKQHFDNDVTISGATTISGAATISGATSLNGATSFALPFAPKSYATAGVPAAASHTGKIIYVTDGDTGNPCLAVSNGTNWLRIALGAAVAAS